MIKKNYKMENLIRHSVFVPIMDTVTDISNHVVVAVLLPDNRDKTRFIKKNKYMKYLGFARSLQLSQMSPMPSPSLSSWPGFATFGTANTFW